MMKQPDLAGIPIIMVTSIRSSEYRGVFPQDEYLHIDSWLDKPCPPEVLVAEVEKTLSRHETFRQSPS
jgi:DNA-binding response OmpR family regulator